MQTQPEQTRGFYHDISEEQLCYIISAANGIKDDVWVYNLPPSPDFAIDKKQLEHADTFESIENAINKASEFCEKFHDSLKPKFREIRAMENFEEKTINIKISIEDIKKIALNANILNNAKNILERIETKEKSEDALVQEELLDLLEKLDKNFARLRKYLSRIPEVKPVFNQFFKETYSLQPDITVAKTAALPSMTVSPSEAKQLATGFRIPEASSIQGDSALNILCFSPEDKASLEEHLKKSFNRIFCNVGSVPGVSSFKKVFDVNGGEMLRGVGTRDSVFWYQKGHRQVTYLGNQRPAGEIDSMTVEVDKEGNLQIEIAETRRKGFKRFLLFRSPELPVIRLKLTQGIFEEAAGITILKTKEGLSREDFLRVVEEFKLEFLEQMEKNFFQGGKLDAQSSVWGTIVNIAKRGIGSANPRNIVNFPGQFLHQEGVFWTNRPDLFEASLDGLQKVLDENKR